MPKSDLAVISTALFRFKGPYGSQWEVICAGVIITIIPTLILFLLLQKQIYSGLTQGSVKE
jgi:multiple sugar transport system permease protein